LLQQSSREAPWIEIDYEGFSRESRTEWMLLNHCPIHNNGTRAARASSIRLNQGIDPQAAAPLRMPQLALSVAGKGCRLRT
jgi:hypothetical protein